MALDGNRQIIHRHALAVIFDQYALEPASLDTDQDIARTSIQRVLDQLLGSSRRTLHNLTRSDAVDRLGRQAVNNAR